MDELPPPCEVQGNGLPRFPRSNLFEGLQLPDPVPNGLPENPFVGLSRPELVPNGLPELRPVPVFDFADVHHLRPGLIPGLSHRQREALTQILIGQRQNRVDRYRLIDEAEDELDTLRYEAHLLREMAARDDDIGQALENYMQRWRDEQDEEERQRGL